MNFQAVVGTSLLVLVVSSSLSAGNDQEVNLKSNVSVIAQTTAVAVLPEVEIMLLGYLRLTLMPYRRQVLQAVRIW